MITEFDASALRKCFLAGASNLIANKDIINELNVFPVPDGDTGTNMSMTISAAASEVMELGETPKMKELCKAIAMGSLRGARGNSGVILSQLLRGFTRKLADEKNINLTVLAAAMNQAVETAYKAVMKPKEGTILTVARAGADKAYELSETNADMPLNEFAEEVLKYTEEALNNTPELLPVLKEAGVVDSGGRGLFEILKGAAQAIEGKESTYSFEVSEGGAAVKGGAKKEAIENADIKYGYCTEFIIKLEKEFNEGTERAFKAFLESIGDSIVCVAMEDIVKVHVHTNHPGQAFEKALNYGQLTHMKVDNMREEHNERLFNMGGGKPVEIELETKAEEEKSGERQRYGIIAVAAGEGLKEIFKSLGADEVIEGGQTMNPSTEDILSAVGRVNADTVFILPNNSNIILAANQAASMSSDSQAIVLPTKTIPQGITALINFIPEHGTDENIQGMMGSIETVRSGQVTYAIRDTVIDGKEVSEGDYMGLGNHSIISSGKDIEEVTVKLISSLADEAAEIVTLYYGKDVAKEEAQKCVSLIESSFPELEVELQYGGQPVYFYIVSVE
ncbi:MAG: DAK2 domain-containing protein [Lachnospiraceae bacterium]|nr:DAK2 domain-containing protein [Lachnospiraceae bacterium]